MNRVNKLFIVVFLVGVAAILYPSLVKNTGAEDVKEIPPDKTVLAIYSVEAKGTEASLAEALSPLLVLYINQYRDNVKIIQNEAVNKALEQQGLAVSGACTDTECLPALGKILGANRFLVTNLSKLKDNFIIIATVYDAETGTSMFSEVEQCQCAEDELINSLDRISSRIMAKLNGKKVKSPTLAKQPVPLPQPEPEKPKSKCPEDMVYIPEGNFCIDIYEFPNKKGEKPFGYIEYDQAVNQCQAIGKRLPTETEWMEACMGPNKLTYPYGTKYDKDICNSTKSILNKRGYVPSGSLPSCKSYYGVYDMAGNMAEWTSTPFEPSSTEHTLKGHTWWGKKRTSCINRISTTGPWTNDVGSRCAKDAE